MQPRIREKGLSVIDVVVVAGVVAFLVFVASLEFPRYQQHEPAPQASE